MNLAHLSTGTTMSKRLATFLLAIAAAAATPAVAAAPAPYTDADLASLTDLVVEMLPLGEVLEQELGKQADWPKSKAGDLSAEQVGCLKSEMSRAGYHRFKRVQVEAYAAQNPTRVKEDVRVLGDGAAALFGRMVRAGMDGARTGTEPDVAKLLAGASEPEMRAFLELVGNEAFSGLRTMIGVEGMLQAKDTEKAGEAAGERMMLDFLESRSKFCHVRFEDLQ